MTQEITRENFTAAIEAVVAERGESFVYEKPEGFRACQYTNEDGTPGCLIGAALAKLGYTAENTRGLERTYPDSYGYSAREILEALGIDDSTLLIAATKAQNRQDDGLEYHAALEAYHAALAFGSCRSSCWGCRSEQRGAA